MPNRGGITAALTLLFFPALLGCGEGELEGWEIEEQSADATSCGKLSISSVSASGHDGNVPSNVLDGNLTTRWSDNGIGSFIIADLGAAKTVCSVQVAWYRGNVRKSNFVISLSSNGQTFTTARSGTSAGNTTGLESYVFASPMNGRYVKVTVNGNSDNTWASMTELSVHGSNVATGNDDLPPPLETFTVSSLSQLQNRIDSAVAGDRIVLANGVYTASRAITISRRGTAANPIVVTAQTVGGVEIRGSAGFRLQSASYVVVRGFKLTHRSTNESGIAVSDCNHVRISRNDFRLDDGGRKSYWVLIGGASGYNRIDHNSFHDKPTEGPFIVVYGDNMSKYDRIDHNYFARQTYGGENGGECLRLGVSSLQLSSAYMTVEQNVFEHCDGDPEVISNKSSDNVIRWNTLRNNNGSIVMRHGHRATVDGNFILGGQSGIRVSGNDHRIINNYIAGTTGSGVRAPITVRSGDVIDVGAGGIAKTYAGYDRPDRVVVAFNTLVNTSEGIVFGDSRKYPPRSCTLANNIVQGSSGNLVEIDVAESLVAMGNLLWGSSSVSGLASSAYRKLDPMLSLSDGLYRPRSGSPAIDQAASSASFSYVLTDMDGHIRTGTFDIGADQVSTQAVLRRPLAQSDVGPASP